MVLVLADVQDLPYDEIATVLDIPVGTVKSRVFRGRAALGQSPRHRRAGNPPCVTGVRGRGMNHPYEQLADLVDGTLDQERPRRGPGAPGHLRLLPRGSCARRAAGRTPLDPCPTPTAPANLHRRVVAAAGGRGHGTPDVVSVGGRGRGRRRGRRDRDRASQRRGRVGRRGGAAGGHRSRRVGRRAAAWTRLDDVT